MRSTASTGQTSNCLPGDILYRSLLDQTAFAVFVSDPDGHCVEVNDAACTMLGYSRQEVLDLPVKDLIPAGEYSDDRMMPEAIQLGRSTFVEHNLVRKDGTLLPVETNAQLLPDKKVLAIVRDLGAQKRAEEEVCHISSLYTILGQVNQTIVRIKNRRALYEAICAIALEYGAFDLVMIGTLNEGGREITLQAFKGSMEDKLYDTIDISKPQFEKSLFSRAVKSGNVVAMGNGEKEYTGIFWSDTAAKRNVNSVAAVPFRVGEKVVGVLSLVSMEPEYFGQKEITLLDEIGMNISFALEMIELEEKRTRVKHALKQGEERYRSVYENAQIGLYRTKPDGKIIMANPALVRMLGFESSEQLIGRGLSQEGFGPDCSRSEFNRRLERDGEVSGNESAWTRHDGRAMYVRESAQVVRDDDGNTLYYEGTIEDITERKIAEQALRTSEDRFRTLFENAPVSLWEEDFSEVKKKLDELRESGVNDIREHFRKDVDGLVAIFDSAKVLSVNKTTLSLYHAASVLQLMRMSGSVSIPEAGPAHVDTLARIWDGEKAYDTETVIRTLTGEVRYVLLRWRVVPGFENDYSKILVSMSDITPLRNFERELEDSREMYRELIENINEIIFSLDNEGRLLYVSPASEKHFGTGVRALIGTHFSTFIYRKDLPSVMRHFEDQKKGNAIPFECRLVVKGGAIRWAFVHAVALFKMGNFVGIRGSLLDITERKEAEMKSVRLGEQLRALASGLQSAREEERMSISREIHDELGQGLTTLKLGISLVRRSLLENRSAKKFYSETNELLELSRSVDDLVNSVRRISASLRPGILDELGLAEAIRWYSEQLSRQSGIQCIIRISPQRIRLEERISTVLFRIFQEALTNAVRHSGADRVEISLSKRSGKVRLAVIDNGCGIAEDKIQDKSSIGILGMKERAMSIGGELTVTRSVSKGTSVKVELQLSQQRAE